MPLKRNHNPDGPDPDVKVGFLLFPSLTPARRMATAGLLILAGIFLPFIFLPWILGGILIVAGSVLMAPKGLSNKPPETAGEGKWEEVTLEEIARLKRLAQRSKRWGVFFLDGNTTLGGILLVGTLIGAAVVALLMLPSGWKPSPWFLLRTAPGHLTEVFFLDVALLAFPLWLLGLKRRFTPNDLFLKIEAIENILERVRVYPADGWKSRVLLELTPAGKGSTPTDARLNFAPKDGPTDFIGIQVQVSLNRVQGTPYPYLYAVVLARDSFGLLDTAFPPAAKIVFERETSDDVDVVVVRQLTTKTSGYHTKAKDQIRVFETALAFAQNSLLPDAS